MTRDILKYCCDSRAWVSVLCMFLGSIVVFVPNSGFAQNCGEVRQVFLLDRTSELNVAEQNALESGIGTLFDDETFGGEIVIGEVRGSSLSSEWIFETCVPANFQVSPACQEYFASVDPNRESDPAPGLLEAPLLWMERALFGDPERVYSNAERISCQQERASFDSRRAELKQEALSAITDVARSGVATSQTALGDTIFRSIENQCSRMKCEMYIFQTYLTITGRRL